MYAIREEHGSEWWAGNAWTPASDEAVLFEDEEGALAEAEELCETRTWIVIEIDDGDDTPDWGAIADDDPRDHRIIAELDADDY